MSSFGATARWWSRHGDGAVCALCPQACILDNSKPEGRCGLRYWNGFEMRTRGYGGVAAIHLDPVEKKPLYHFMPGSRTFSLGMTGCNLSCSFCQNGTLSAARDGNSDWIALTPRQIVERALELGAQSVAFTYNEPIIAAEFWIEVADECHAHGLKTIAVSNGYANPQAAHDFYGAMDAANIDLKAFRPDFYRNICKGHLSAILHNLKIIHGLPGCHLEITNLLIPQRNDDAEEIVAMCRWIFEELGPDVPLHFTAWHPDYQAMDWPTDYRTDPHEARQLALSEGLLHVYTGNVHDISGSTTRCPACGEELVIRDGFNILSNRIVGGKCPKCQTSIYGRWE